MSLPGINLHGIWAIYRFEMARSLRTLWQSLVGPVLTTSLYFIVFGGAIGSRMQSVDGVSYGSFIVPGLIMLSLLTQSVGNASIGDALYSGTPSAAGGIVRPITPATAINVRT